jgi:hypothetical protein
MGGNPATARMVYIRKLLQAASTPRSEMVQDFICHVAHPEKGSVRSKHRETW